MKKLLALLFVALFLVGCGEKKPEDVAVNFVETIYSGDAKAMMKFIDIPDDAFQKDGSKEVMEGKFQMMASEAKGKSAAMGGLEQVKASQTELENDRANVNVEVKFKNGEIKNENVRLSKTKDGWKVKL